MKILHISALDGQTGAGVAAARIHNGLLERGIESRFCVAYPAAGLKNAFTPPVTLAGRVARTMRQGISARLLAPHARGYDYVLSTGLSGHDVRRIVAAEQPDVVHLHWIAGNAFRLASLAGIRVPIVWRLSDMWPFCGLEHLEPDAGYYTLPPSRNFTLLRTRSDLSEFVRRRKQAIYAGLRNLTLVSPSRWLAAEARKSALLGDREVALIPTSCETDVFAPKSPRSCRDVLGLAPDKFLILVGATSMGTRWKGMDLFVEALARTAESLGESRRSEIRVVTFGLDPFKAPRLEGLVAVDHLGQIRDRRLMSILYSAADVFVAPSRMENLANTVLESLACGAPVVAFNIGGMPDMIEHERNGYLAEPFDITQMADGLRWALRNRDSPSIRAASRDKILRDFSLKGEIDRYVELYGGLLSSCKPDAAGAGLN